MSATSSEFRLIEEEMKKCGREDEAEDEKEDKDGEQDVSEDKEDTAEDKVAADREGAAARRTSESVEAGTH